MALYELLGLMLMPPEHADFITTTAYWHYHILGLSTHRYWNSADGLFEAVDYDIRSAKTSLTSLHTNQVEVNKLYSLPKTYFFTVKT